MDIYNKIQLLLVLYLDVPNWDATMNNLNFFFFATHSMQILGEIPNIQTTTMIRSDSIQTNI